MHVYRKTKEEGQWLYTVGYFVPESGTEVQTAQWMPLADTSDEQEAMAMVNYLNGGMGYLFRYKEGK